MSWTDDFSHDYFADSTYTVTSGAAEGTDYNESGGVLHVLGPTSLVWFDEHANGRTGTVEIDFDLAAFDGGINLGLASPDGSTYVAGNFSQLVGGSGDIVVNLFASDGSGALGYSTDGVSTLNGVTLPTSGAVTVRLEADESSVTMTLVGHGALSMTYDGSVVDAGAIMNPRGVLFLVDGGPLTFTRWFYDVVAGGGGGGGGGGRSIAVGAAPPAIPADGSSVAHVIAHVNDGSGAPLAGETVTFDPAGQFGATIDNGDGSYSAIYTATTVPGVVAITAHDAALSAVTTLTQTASAPGAGVDGTANAGLHTTGVVHHR